MAGAQAAGNFSRPGRNSLGGTGGLVGLAAEISTFAQLVGVGRHLTPRQEKRMDINRTENDGGGHGLSFHPRLRLDRANSYIRSHWLANPEIQSCRQPGFPTAGGGH